jgi:hypothetical protein
MSDERTNAHPPTADRLRHDISRGKAGDKVDHPDLAAAPLGTDDEAAGKPPTLEERWIAAAETAPSKPPEERLFGVEGFYAAMIIAIFAVFVTAVVTLR